MPANNDVLAGILFIALGILFGAYIYATLDVGTPRAMGPGYIPSRLCGLLILFGVLIALRSQPASTANEAAIAWRGLITLTGSTVLFGLMIGPFGLVPALAVASLLAAWASRRMTPLFSLALTASLLVICVVIFYWLLGTPLQLFGTWLRI
jgi:hypothetical protein